MAATCTSTTCHLCGRALSGNTMGNKRHFDACRTAEAKRRGLVAGASVTVAAAFGEHGFGEFDTTLVKIDRHGYAVVASPNGGAFEVNPNIVSLS